MSGNDDVLGKNPDQEEITAFKKEMRAFHLTPKEESTYGSIVMIVSGVALLVVLFLGFLIYSNTRDYMKKCEKLLLLNIVVPDAINALFVLGVVGPATMKSHWQFTLYQTRWLAYLHTAFTFHGHLGCSFICYVIALSMSDVYRFEKTNKMKYMVVLVASSVCITMSLCSLPGIEDAGYTFLANWMGPAFDIEHDYGSIMMASSILGIIVPANLLSFIQFFKVRKFFSERRAAKITERAVSDLEKIIVFNTITLVNAFLLLPLIIGFKTKKGMLAARMLAQFCPVLRVFSIVVFCPHFRFSWLSSANVDDLGDQLAVFANDDDDMAAEQDPLESTFGVLYNEMDLENSPAAEDQ